MTFDSPNKDEFTEYVIQDIKYTREVQKAIRLINFESFLRECISLLHTVIDSQRLNLFFTLRYRILYKHYPHKPFSVEESSADFFIITLQYLKKERSLDEIPKSEYSQNYRKWVESFF
jgi:hypothetical protein